jgi:hypothetical protein
MAKVNPPPQIRRPPKISQDRELRPYFERLEWLLFQLWTRTGGSSDSIEDNAEPVVATAFAQLKDLAERVGSGEALTVDTTSWTVDTTRFYADETEA